MTQPTLDQPRAEAFANRLLGTMNHAALALMTSLGHRTGLFDVLSELPPSTSGQVARAAGLSERYVREWLGAMVTAGVVEFEPRGKTYSLPAEHAACLTRKAASGNMASMMQWVAVLGGAEDAVAEAFRHGAGVPYSAYHRFHEVMAEESQATTVDGLQDHILPLVPGLDGRLMAGLDVLDVGCGAGRAMIRLAELYPASRFVGYDLCPDAIEAAERRAKHRGVGNVRFEVRDVAGLQDRQAFDLVTAFDAIHDQAKPARVLEGIRRALRPGGVFLMQDIAAATDLAGNRQHPLGTFLYTISCMHCMSVSLANGGPGLGAVWGKELALHMLNAAGFASVRVESLPHDIINYYYIAS
jgi:SAM-dependent methyltransferase